VLGQNHIDFVFHGGSGSTVEEIRESISYGVIKMNIDTDMQYAFMTGYSRLYPRKIRLFKTQIGNPEGDDQPNKKYYDPRKWLREGRKTFVRTIKASI
jgi:fructose-bisphosphate aldolase class II